MELYNSLINIKNHNHFNKYSDIYVDEFFMYIYISSKKEQIFPTIEIYNILSNLTDDLINKINYILNYHNKKNITISNFKYFYEASLDVGQENLIKYMKEIFNHDCTSEKIKKIKLNIEYNNINFPLIVYNNDKIIDVKSEIKEYLLYEKSIKININRIILKYNNFILTNNDLDFYNIKDNSQITVLINMDNKPMI
jgi:hypothetical protein